MNKVLKTVFAVMCFFHSVFLFAGTVVLDSSNMCSAMNSSQNNGISISDMPGSIECYGVFKGNLSKGGNPTIIYKGRSFSEITKLENSTAVDKKIGFKASGINARKGTWEFTQGAINDLFMIMLKASNRYAVYVFNSPSNSLFSGAWNIAFTNKGGKIPALSHISVYGTKAKPAKSVTAPASLALLSLCLIGIFSISRRRNN